MPFYQLANNHKLWGPTVGAPSNGLGRNGDFYSRADGGSMTKMYVKASGTWSGIA